MKIVCRACRLSSQVARVALFVCDIRERHYSCLGTEPLGRRHAMEALWNREKAKSNRDGVN